MSDLQTVLIVIGALIIVVVLIVNWWQEKRFHQQVESSFSPLHSDALLDDPKLDVNGLYGGFDDPAIDSFAFDNERTYESLRENSTTEDIALSSYEPDRFNQEVQLSKLGDTLPDDVSIDDAYSQLSNAMSKGFSSPNLESKTKKNKNLNAEVKPAQHNDIKAIFEDAFSHSTKVTESHEKIKLEAEANEGNLNSIQNKTQNDTNEDALSLPAMLHAQMDLTAVLYLAAETPSNKLVNSLVGLLDGYDKPIFVHILDSKNHWILLKDANISEKVSRVACSMQLADRAGAVSRNLLNRFQLAVETFGLDINAHVEWQSSGDALTTATALDTFCIEVDKTIGFHLVHGENGVFTGTKLRGLAEAQGLTLSPDGTFKCLNDFSQASFVMFNREDYPFSPEMLRNSVIKGITFQLDIPHVKHCTEAFSQMVQVAKQMEVGLNAMLVDDNNKMLGDIQIEKIRQQLKVIQATMLVRGIVPGSDNAIRLFS